MTQNKQNNNQNNNYNVSIHTSVTVRHEFLMTRADSKMGNSNYPTLYKNTTNQSNYAKDKLMKFLNKRYRPND